MTISGRFFVNYINIFQKTEISTVILRCFTYLNLNWIKIYNIKHKFSHFWFFRKLTELTKTNQYMKPYFSALSWILLDRIIVQAPSMCHFKCLGMRNLENEIRICQNTHTQPQFQGQCCPVFFFWNIHYYRKPPQSPCNSLQTFAV